MVFLKSFVAGLVALAGYVALLCLAMLWSYWQMWRSIAESGAGGVGFVFAVSPLLLIPGLLGFAAAFWWEWRRAAR
jgi:hypothetical protein